MGSDVRLAGPAELHPPKDVVDLAHQVAERTGARITVTDDAGQAVAASGRAWPGGLRLRQCEAHYPGPRAP